MTQRPERPTAMTNLDVMDHIFDALDHGDAARVSELLEPLHAADIADILEQMPAGRRRALLALWSGEIDGDILSEIDESIREEVVAALSPDVLAEAVRELDSDDVVDLLEDLDAAVQERVLDALEDGDRAVVEQSLAYPEYSAGRLMQREVVTAPEHWTVGEAIDHLRSAEWLPDQFYHVTLVDPRIKPVANVTLGRILSSRREALLREIAEEEFRTIGATESETDVAYLFNQYHLISAPVVDDGGRLVGVITIDDAMAVLDEEHEEDMLRMAGVSDDSSLSDRIVDAAKGRAVWLFVNLLTAILASRVIDYFSGAIDQMVALAVLMPVVASMGGNAGSQTMAVTVRALATRDLTAQNALRVVWREVAVGAVNGVVFGLTLALVTGLWFGVPMLAVVIGVALGLTLVAAALAGIAIPMALEKAGVDPALASGPLVTTLTDIVAFTTFLGLASKVLL